MPAPRTIRKIDWTRADPVVRLQVRDELGDVALQQRLTISQLRK